MEDLVCYLDELSSQLTDNGAPENKASLCLVIAADGCGRKCGERPATRVMAGKYDWNPGQGVRSVSDVFNLIVEENGLLADALSGTPNKGAEPAPITDPGKMQDALKASYANLQKAITGLSDNDLQTHVKLFGEDMTKQDALMLILEDQHEHLGQSIAYARTNGVVPPWSK